MSPKEKIVELNDQARKIQTMTRELNKSSSELSGVAAVVPSGMPAPLRFFTGNKIILHNVAYDFGIGGLTATAPLPYINTEGPNACAGGQVLQFNIDETWFQ